MEGKMGKTYGDISVSISEGKGSQIGDWDHYLPRIIVRRKGRLIAELNDSYEDDVIVYDGFMLVRERSTREPQTNGFYNELSTEVTDEWVYILDQNLCGPIRLDEFLKKVAIKV
jgi:hypothetical protein